MHNRMAQKYAWLMFSFCMPVCWTQCFISIVCSVHIQWLLWPGYLNLNPARQPARHGEKGFHFVKAFIGNRASFWLLTCGEGNELCSPSVWFYLHICDPMFLFIFLIYTCNIMLSQYCGPEFVFFSLYIHYMLLLFLVNNLMPLNTWFF